MGGCTKEILLSVRMSLNVQFPLLSWVSISNFPGIPVPWILHCGKVGRVSACPPQEQCTLSTPVPQEQRCKLQQGGIFQTLRSAVAPATSIICLVFEYFTHGYNAFHLFLLPTFFNSLPPKLSPALTHRSLSHSHDFFFVTLSSLPT